MKIPHEDMEICLQVLQQIANSSGAISRGERFNSLISKIYREGKKHDLRAEKWRQVVEDRALLAATSMVQNPTGRRLRDGPPATREYQW